MTLHGKRSFVTLYFDCIDFTEQTVHAPLLKRNEMRSN